MEGISGSPTIENANSFINLSVAHSFLPVNLWVLGFPAFEVILRKTEQVSCLTLNSSYIPTEDGTNQMAWIVVPLELEGFLFSAKTVTFNRLTSRSNRAVC